MRSQIKLTLLFFLPLFGGCEWSQTFQQYQLRFKTKWERFVYQKSTPQNSPSTNINSKFQGRPSLTPNERNPSAEKEILDFIKGNEQLVHEAYFVLFSDGHRTVQVPFQPEDYQNIISQMASIEGIQNGWLYSTDYQSLEKEPVSAGPAALSFFKTQVRLFSSVLYQSEEEAKKYVNDLDVLSLPANIYQLKKLISKEVLAVIWKLKKEDPLLLAKWYAHSAMALNELGIQFGLESRNKVDYEFHYIWANQMLHENKEDRIVWETLNRFYRALNFLNIQK